MIAFGSSQQPQQASPILVARRTLGYKAMAAPVALAMLYVFFAKLTFVADGKYVAGGTVLVVATLMFVALTLATRPRKLGECAPDTTLGVTYTYIHRRYGHVVTPQYMAEAGVQQQQLDRWADRCSLYAYLSYVTASAAALCVYVA